MDEFTLKPVAEVQTADDARDIAVEWQSWQSERSVSWSDLVHYSDHFQKLAEKFNLTEEFLENGII